MVFITGNLKVVEIDVDVYLNRIGDNEFTVPILIINFSLWFCSYLVENICKSVLETIIKIWIKFCHEKFDYVNP